MTLDERADRDAVYRLFDKAVGFYRDEPAAVRKVAEEELRSAPRKIIEMIKLYQPEGETGAYGDVVTSLEKQQSEYRNFCRQGKFMEDFEDDWDRTGSTLPGCTARCWRRPSSMVWTSRQRCYRT